MPNVPGAIWLLVAVIVILALAGAFALVNLARSKPPEPKNDAGNPPADRGSHDTKD